MDWFSSAQVESSLPLDAILNEIPSLDKTLTFAKEIKEKQANNKLNTANQSMTKNLAKSASNNFSTRGTTFRHRISQSSLPSFSPYPSHLALPFLVSISPFAVSLLYEDYWGRVRSCRSFRNSLPVNEVKSITLPARSMFQASKFLA